MKKKRKKLYSFLKTAKAIQRDLEIQEHGKVISLRPTKVFKSKKEYKREKFRIDENNDAI